MAGLLVFLHGLNGDKDTWGSVPDLVKRSLEDFEVTTPEFSSGKLSGADIAISAEKIFHEISIKYPQNDPIYFIGFSMGGLIARELCRKLLAREIDNDPFLDRIAASLDVATPLHGSKWKVLTLLCRQVISDKIMQLEDIDFVCGAYKRAIEKAKERLRRRPKHFHIQLEDDRVINRHSPALYTEDDHSGGVTGGSHRTFLRNNPGQTREVADILLENIRLVQNSFSKPYVKRSDLHADAQLPERLILLSCSRGKIAGGVVGFGDQLPRFWETDTALRQSILSKRSYVYAALKAAKIANGLERGNRAHQVANQTLRHGPDLGGVANSGAYLPAHERYTGRCYAPISPESWAAYEENKADVTVLIMSGLYGLVEAGEVIQNYDVHLTDTHVDSGQPVATMWTELLTETLGHYVKRAYRGRKIQIMDLLCDHHYVDAIRWHTLPKECSVFHLASDDLEGVQLLPAAGTIANRLLCEPRRIDNLERDKPYALASFGVPPQGELDVSVIFERNVGSSKRIG